MSFCNNVYIHPLADVQTTHIGNDTCIWQFVVISPDARIGRNCNICAHCFIENDVIIGDRVTIKNGVHLWNGLRIADDVFVGSNVTFSTEKSFHGPNAEAAVLGTEVASGVWLGAGATILPNLKIGRGAVVEAGSTVTRSVPPNAIVEGSPAKIVGYANAKNRSSGAIQEQSRQSVITPPLQVAGAKLITLPRIADIRGSLTVGEFQRNIPFYAKRYFMVFDVPSVETRGEHAHRECHQFLVCVRGTVSVVADDGVNREEFTLDRPNIGLYLAPMVWSIQYGHSRDAMLLVFASHYYDSADYIRDYSEFLNAVDKAKP